MKVKGVEVVEIMHSVTTLNICPLESHSAVKHTPFPSVVL